MIRAAVVTDSSSQLDPLVAKRSGITVVPMTVVIDGAAVDEDDVDVDLFYDRLLRGELITTSPPPPGRFLDAYREAERLGSDEIISIHLDGRVSSAVAAAHVASAASPVSVTVIETRQLSYGVGVCALAAARAVRAGRTVADVVLAVGEVAGAIENLFVAPTAGKGRIGRGMGWNVLSHADGVVQIVAPSAEPADAVQTMVDLVRARGEVYAAVGYAGATVGREADELYRRLIDLPNVAGVDRYRVGPSVGAHAGPHSMGLFTWPAG